ncbi:MAG: hypothetical protein COS40_05625 [Deltaproteobacteria bacterium CG03_land_8_20_14_0_80_45_14]|nr:MAG: hypothetical protein COS40_05625 [Deltaproteobacteria bacterium CG03_land_8_20_14_0_80_45_14]
MESILKIGDKVRVGDKIGKIIRLNQRDSSTIIKVAFGEGPAKDFVYPPTKAEKILSPIEQIQNNKFDSPIHFDLHYEAIRLSLAYAYDHLLLLSFTRTNLEPYQVEFNNEIRDASLCDVNKFLPKIEDLHHNAYSAALQKAKDFCTSVQMRKSREINIKREDAKNFFDRRIKEEEERLKDYRLRQSLGEDMAIAIRGSERRIEDLNDELKKALDRFEEEELVIERNPELFSVAIIMAKGKS